MRRRAVASTLLLLCALILVVSGGGRPAPSYAAVVLKPGDVVLGGTPGYFLMDGASGAMSELPVDIAHVDETMSIAVGPNGEIYDADNAYNDGIRQQPSVIRIDPSTGAQTVVATGFNYFRSLSSGPDGSLYAVDTGAGAIIRINPQTGAKSTVGSGGLIVDPSDAAIERDGSVLTSVLATPANINGPHQIIRIRSDKGTQEVVSTGGLLNWPRWLAVGPDGSIFTSDFGRGETRVIRVNPQTGAQSVVVQFASGSALGGLAVEPSGTLLLARNDGPNGLLLVVRVDPTTGSVTLANRPSFTVWVAASLAVVPGLSTPAPPPVPAVNRAPTKVTVTEGGSQTFTLNLSWVPSSAVTVNFVYDSSQFTVSPPSVTFPPYPVPGAQTAMVTVTAKDDTVLQGNRTLPIHLSASSSDPAFNHLAIDDEQVTIADNEAPANCNPRPRVGVQTSTQNGALQVTVSATSQSGLSNALHSLTWNSLVNASVTLDGVGPVSQGQVTTLPVGSQTATFQVRRSTADQPTTVRFTVSDACGEWRTFVGGGPGAF